MGWEDPRGSERHVNVSCGRMTCYLEASSELSFDFVGTHEYVAVHVRK